MAYSEFDLADLPAKFGVSIADHPDLFPGVQEVPLSPPVQDLLRLYYPLALANGTEKARSEWLIAPVLADVREQLGRQVSLFSGWDFVVDRARGLNGVCDFLLCRSPQQEFLTVPVAVIVEAKNENIKAGLGQCAAEMIAARVFNERDGATSGPMFGCVTSGNVWRFLRLVENELLIEQTDYHLLTQAGRIAGILIHILRGPVRVAGQAA
jgi:hypothetical protein